ncbi:MAG TPA: NADH-quinone oxidoreductase subunit D, partial [Planctomycetia bacterium]|nr:NADH-quinone oxidoreductase subunit D [Planctomycetia bacterium]
MAETKNMILNMGPQHPSTHGVLRLILELDGETVVKLTPEIGYLHRGVEKLGENLTYHQFIPLTDREDYIASLSNNLAYCMTVEKLLGLEVPPRAMVARVLLTELQRIASHLIWLGTFGLDIGAMSLFFYCMREREQILDMFEACAGARLTINYFAIGGLRHDLPEGFETRVRDFIKIFPERMKNDYERIFQDNKIVRMRTEGVGIISKEDAIDLGLSGPLLRACGVPWDIRKSNPYCGYETYDFDIATGKVGDVFDRYMIRMEEMRQSLKIIQQALDRLPGGPFLADDPKVCLPSKQKVMTEMESLIHHFKIVSEGFEPPVGEVYHSIETPRGELGFYIVSDGSNKPYRLRFRPPSFVNLES